MCCQRPPGEIMGFNVLKNKRVKFTNQTKNCGVSRKLEESFNQIPMSSKFYSFRAYSIYSSIIFFCLHVWISVYLFIYLISICPSVSHKSGCPSISLSTSPFLSVFMSFIHISFYLSVFLSICPYIYLPIFLSTYLSFYLYLSVSFCSFISVRLFI